MIPRYYVKYVEALLIAKVIPLLEKSFYLRIIAKCKGSRTIKRRYLRIRLSIIIAVEMKNLFFIMPKYLFHSLNINDKEKTVNTVIKRQNFPFSELSFE